MTVLRRRPGIASVAALAGITAALTVAHAAAPGWVRAAGLDVWNLTDLLAEQRDEADRKTDLEIYHEDLRRQVAVADRLRERLLDGGVTLAAAADEVLRANRDRSEFLMVLQMEHPGATTDRELAAQYLIHKVADHFHDDPSRRAAETGRLETELHALRVE